MSTDPKRLLRARWPESASRPVVSPLMPSVVYASDDADTLDQQYEGEIAGYTYAREGHPNATVLASLLDAMEGAEGGSVVGSGMAAVSLALLATASAGDHVVGADQLYGRSLRLMTEELPRLGIDTSLADPTDFGAIESAITPKTKLILIETVSNPTLRVSDIAGIVELAHRHGVLVAVDNTFATPLGLQPVTIGADIVLHSVTKLLSGHSDATLGYIVAKDPGLNERFGVLSATYGFTASPFDCWLAERGLYSFELRYERTTTTAARLADRLAEHSAVKRVIYPTRRDHPDHNRAVSLLNGEGGHMVSFEVEGGRQKVNAFIRAASGISFAPTLGDVATTLSHPPTSSHRAMSEEQRNALGISEGFFRVSVGCENPDGLIGAFQDALDAL